MPTLAPAAEDTFSVDMTDGTPIAVRRYGIGRGPCIVMSHGNGFAIDGYRVFWEPLAHHCELALFDLRNHGRNAPSTPDRHTYLQFATDIGSVQAGLRARLAPGRKLVGAFHSASARAAMKHATQLGGTWDALVLFDPPNVPPRGHALYDAMRAFELKLVEFAAGRPDRFDHADAMVAVFRESRAASRWLPQAVEDMGRAVVHPAAEGGWTLACRRELEAMIYLAALTMDLWPSASAFRCPVQLIGADPGLKGTPPTGLANQALAREHGYAYAAIAGTSHMLQVEQPEACRQAMQAFLETTGIL
jgi:pimeloyl-ACP methyl ester carboxylesterase